MSGPGTDVGPRGERESSESPANRTGTDVRVDPVSEASVPESRPGREAWVYESIVGAVPGVEVGTWAAHAVHFAGFEVAVVACWAFYDLPSSALVAGTVVVAVASAGSVAMVTIADAVRAGNESPRYRRLVLGSRFELVLGLLAFLGLVTYLFVVDPRDSPVLLESVLGPDPPAPAVFLLLLLCWDVCYRIGTSWWAGVTALWRTVALADGHTEPRLRQRLDRATFAFGVLQLSLVPFVLDHPLLLGALSGHVAAVGLVSGTARFLERRNEN